MQQRTHKL